VYKTHYYHHQKSAEQNIEYFWINKTVKRIVPIWLISLIILLSFSAFYPYNQNLRSQKYFLLFMYTFQYLFQLLSEVIWCNGLGTDIIYIYILISCFQKLAQFHLTNALIFVVHSFFWNHIYYGSLAKRLPRNFS
jgi:hypothetical protein